MLLEWDHSLVVEFIYFTHMLFLCATFALFLLLSVRCYAKSADGTRYGVTRNAPLTTNHLPKKANPWLHQILAKQNCIAPFTCSISRLPESWHTAKPCTIRECSRANSTVFIEPTRKSYRLRSMTKPWKPFPASKPMIVTASAESETLGTRNYATLTMFSFMPKSAESNSPSSARNADSLSQF